MLTESTVFLLIFGIIIATIVWGIFPWRNWGSSTYRGDIGAILAHIRWIICESHRGCHCCNILENNNFGNLAYDCDKDNVNVGENDQDLILSELCMANDADEDKRRMMRMAIAFQDGFLLNGYTCNFYLTLKIAFQDGFLPNGETTLHTRELVVPSIGKVLVKPLLAPQGALSHTAPL